MGNRLETELQVLVSLAKGLSVHLESYSSAISPWRILNKYVVAHLMK